MNFAHLLLMLYYLMLCYLQHRTLGCLIAMGTLTLDFDHNRRLLKSRRVFLVFFFDRGKWQVAISRNIDTQKQVANVDSQDLDLWVLHIFPPITILNFKVT